MNLKIDKNKGSIVFWLNLLFVIFGVGLLIYLISENTDIIKNVFLSIFNK